MIEVQHLTKRYGRVTAVDDVSFRVEPGEILGFLGPNGAGKTTTMRILTGYMPASEGRATVAGYDVFTHPIEAKARTGYLPETPPLYPDMTVREYLTFVAKIKIGTALSTAERKIMETQVDEVKRQAYAQIARAQYAVEGANTYPDATFTLRLAFGVVKGYEEDGKQIPFETTFAGLYERSAEHHDKYPFDLPKRWIERKDKLDLNTPFNFVCTADIIGGNSGSPVINRNAEVVGLIFDGNIQSLVLDFIYDEKQARAVAVHSQGIVEALRKVYDADAPSWCEAGTYHWPLPAH